MRQSRDRSGSGSNGFFGLFQDRFAFAKMALNRTIMIPVDSKVVWKNIVLKIKIQNCRILGILYLAMVAKKRLVFRQARESGNIISTEQTRISNINAPFIAKLPELPHLGSGRGVNPLQLECEPIESIVVALGAAGSVVPQGA